MTTAPVSAIQHFCLHDGPGVRSTVFFKGCPLRCAWCHNPESQRVTPELGFKEHLCIGCRRCVEVCGARSVPGLPDPDRCTARFACAQECPASALTRFGAMQTVEAIVGEIQPEFPLLASSGGGVTLSGGEPTVHAAFAAQLATALAEQGVHVALQTCGAFDPDAPGVEVLLASVDLLLFDVKLVDAAQHRRWTGQGNEAIVANLRRLAGRQPLWPRMPLVPGVNDAPDELDAVADLLAGCGLRQITVVPYHPMGIARSVWLGRGEGQTFETPNHEQLGAVRARFEASGLTVFEPGEER